MDINVDEEEEWKEREDKDEDEDEGVCPLMSNLRSESCRRRVH